ncbi:NlpC/P60 family protein [Actinomadura vinacea]|uniref:NlpC/P60 family protein n=1 Tax=Actinomadura vinacea TaxID=115336 RepID=A0ABN3KDE7_9ACTN
MPLLIGAVVAVLMLAAVFVAVLGAVLPGSDSGEAACQPPSGQTGLGIPAVYGALYLKAGQRYGIGWHVLAAVGKIESDHGRGTEPGIKSGTNQAGAAGPMQFLAGTWAAFGVDGDRDGDKDVYDPADAVPGAARYLKHEGAPDKIHQALFRYNHSTTYVQSVLRQARAYAKAGETTRGASSTAPQASGACGEVDAFPVQAPGQAASKAITFARAQLGKPYGWGAEGPDSFDCSGLTFAAYRSAGITIPRVSGDQWRHGPKVPRGRERPGDLVFFNSGPGTTTTNPGHVGLVIAPGKMIAAPRTGTVIQIQSYNRSNLLGFTRPTPRR